MSRSLRRTVRSLGVIQVMGIVLEWGLGWRGSRLTGEGNLGFPTVSFSMGTRDRTQRPTPPSVSGSVTLDFKPGGYEALGELGSLVFVGVCQVPKAASLLHFRLLFLGD